MKRGPLPDLIEEYVKSGDVAEAHKHFFDFGLFHFLKIGDESGGAVAATQAPQVFSVGEQGLFNVGDLGLYIRGKEEFWFQKVLGEIELEVVLT